MSAGLIWRCWLVFHPLKLMALHTCHRKTKSLSAVTHPNKTPTRLVTAKALTELQLLSTKTQDLIINRLGHSGLKLRAFYVVLSMHGNKT